MAELKAFRDSFNIDAFRQNFVNGARDYLFYVIPSFPSSIKTYANNLKTNPTYLVRSSSIPERSVEAAQVNWQGYTYNLGGKSNVQDWTVSYTVDKTAGLYKVFLKWIDLVHNPTTNVHGDPNDFMVDQNVQVLSLDGSEAIIDVKLVGCWASNVGQLSLDYSSSNILSFDVTYKILRVEYNTDDIK